MENMHSSLDRCLFLLPISIHAVYVFKKGILRIILNIAIILTSLGIAIFTNIIISL